MRLFTAVFLSLVLVTGGATAQYPRGVFAEDATATWCVYCPYAYAGLDVMKNSYDTTEFNVIRYYATSGDYGSPETNARISYYGVSGFPTVIFNGTVDVVGGSPVTATGSQYDPIVANSIAVPSPLKITINSVDLTDPGSIDFDIEVMESMADIGNVKIRAFLIENDLGGIHTDATRDVLPDVPLTVSSLGEIQNVVHNFAVDAEWIHELWMAVMVQDDDDKSILQSASTRTAPDYSIRFWAKGSRGVVVPNSGRHSFQDFAVYNLGLNADVIRVALDASEMPVDWDCSFSDDNLDYEGFVDLALAPGESRVFHLNVTPNSSGYAMPRIVLTSDNLVGVERVIRYNVVTNDVNILFVDDDGADAYEEYHKAAMEDYGSTYGIWDRNLAEVGSADLTQFSTVFWQTGVSYPSLDAADRAALSGFLDAGGNLFLTGQDIGWDIWDQGGDAVTWYRTYLHTNYLLDDTNRNALTGVPGDIMDGVTLVLAGGDGANNNTYPSAVQPYDEFASGIFTYDNTAYTAATKANNGVHKVVYLAFPYESIDNAGDRSLLTARVLGWFDGSAGIGDDVASFLTTSVRAYPNPAPGAAVISYALPTDGRAKLEIYALDGSVIRTLLDGDQPAGRHALQWDGRDDAGQRMASGIYFYQLSASEGNPTGRLILTR